MAGSSNVVREALIHDSAKQMNMSIREIEEAFQQMNAPLIGNWKTVEGLWYKFRTDNSFEFGLGAKVMLQGDYQVIGDSLFLHSKTQFLGTFGLSVSENSLTVIDEQNPPPYVYQRS